MSFFNVSPLGVITTDTSEIKTEIEEAYKKALGGNLNLEASTPQGQLIINDTNNLTTTMEEVVNLASSFSVYTAEDKALDASGLFFGYFRKQGTKTAVLCTLGGLGGTMVNAGAAVSDGTNNFILLDNVTIGEDGTATAEFQCVTVGKIPCVAGSINTILTPLDGWDIVTNDIDGIAGLDYESDNEFRQRITANQLAIRSTSILGSIADRIGALQDVLSVTARENQTGNIITIDNIDLLPHSIYLCILGGSGEAIAKVLTQSKTLGASTNGDIMVSYYDKEIDYTYNYMIYRPDFVNIKVQITYKNNQYTPLDVADKVKNEVMDYVQNNPFKIGVGVSANIFDKSTQNINYIGLVSFKVGIVGGDLGYFVDIDIKQIAILSLENIEVVNIA
jgi:hypothetical protein